jgi:hypothetical protein
MKQALAIFALLVAVSQSANCPAYTPTFGAAYTTVAATADNTEAVLPGCGAATAEGNAPTARCQVDCTATGRMAGSSDTPSGTTPNLEIVVYAPYNYNDYAYGNFIYDGIDATRPAADTDYGKYGGGASTCTTTTTFAQADCQGASYFSFKIAITAGASAAAKLGMANNAANVGTYKVGVDCAVLAAFDASWCRLASKTQVAIANGVVLSSSDSAATSDAANDCGNDATDTDLVVTYIIRVNAQVMSAAAVATRAAALDIDGGATHAVGTYWTALKAAITQMVTDSAATGAAAVGTEQVGTAGAITWASPEVGYLYATGPGASNPWKDIAASTTKGSNPINSCDVAAAKFYALVRACDGSAARQIANGNQGDGKTYCTGSVAQTGCQHGCVDGYVPYGADATSNANKGMKMGAISYITIDATTVSVPTALAVGTGGGSKCAADGTFTAGTCVRSFKGSIDITVGTNIATDKADYDTTADAKKQRQVECAFMNVLKASCCTPANGGADITDATMTTCRGVALSSSMSASGGIITFQFNVANSVTSEHALRTALGTAATVKTNLVAAINAVQTTASHYTLTGIVVGDVTTVGAVTQGMCYLDQQAWDLTGVTLQSNSSAGCGVALAPGATCTPVCGTGYSAASTTVSCSSSGVLTGYNCSVAPTPTPTASNTSCTYGATSTCATRVTQTVTISSLTAAAYTGNTKSTYECGYAQTVTSTWCTATSGTVTYLSGVQISSSAARRAATITFVMDVETTVMTAANVQTAVASGVTASALVAKMTAINTATGWSVTVPAEADITVNTAAFAGAASGAGALVPSALAALAGVASLLMM